MQKYIIPKTAFSILGKIKDLPKFERPREDNQDYGYLEIKRKRYYQLYTTIEVKDSHVPPGSHYHRIDLRGEK